MICVSFLTSSVVSLLMMSNMGTVTAETVCDKYRRTGAFDDDCSPITDEAACKSRPTECVWKYNTCRLIPNDSCCGTEEGYADVRMATYPRGLPEVFYNGKWNELCAEQFSNNHNGAQVFCRGLGFHSGLRFKVKRKYPKAALNVGYCRGSDHRNPKGVFGCTGGSNNQKPTFRCKKGKRKGIDIRCSLPYIVGGPNAPDVIYTHTCDRAFISCSDEAPVGRCRQILRSRQCKGKRHARLCNRTCGRCKEMDGEQ